MFMFHAIGNFRNVNFSSLSLFFFFCDKQHKDEGEKNLMCVNCEARRFWHLIKSSHDSLWCRRQINIKREKRGKSNSSHGVDETLISNTTENWQRKLKWKCFLIEKNVVRVQFLLRAIRLDFVFENEKSTLNFSTNRTKWEWKIT